MFNDNASDLDRQKKLEELIKDADLSIFYYYRNDDSRARRPTL